MIQIKHVSHYYQQHKALDDISCHLPHKQCIALLGENGAGKSTLMKLLVGNLPASEGKIYIDGQLMYPESEARSLIGYLPESISLYNSMIVRDYLIWIARMHGLTGKKKSLHLDRVVEQCDLHSLIRLPIQSLSKGMRQRVGLAQALIHQPTVLILDEIHSGLDYQQSQSMNELLRHLSQHYLIVMSTHRLHTIEHIADHVLILDHGSMKAFDTLDHVKQWQQSTHVYHIQTLIDLAQTTLEEHVSSFQTLCDSLAMKVRAHQVEIIPPHFTQNSSITTQHKMIRYECLCPRLEQVDFLSSMAQKFVITEAYMEKNDLAQLFAQLTQNENKI